MTTVEQEALYHLIRFDKIGREIAMADNSYASAKIVDDLETKPITDVFIMSHGWQTDLGGAYKQYNDWYHAVSLDAAGRDSLNSKRGGKFYPLVVGLHWPSLLGGREGGKSVDADDEEELIAFITEDEQAQDELRTIGNSISAACMELNESPGTANGAKAFDCDPLELLKQELIEVAKKLGKAINTNVGKLLDKSAKIAEFALANGLDANYVFLKIVSFWRMREMARQVGERGGYKLLCQMQQAVPEGRDVKFHLIGHSFGCILVSATMAGTNCDNVKSVDTVLLLQGALGLWSYCLDDPSQRSEGDDCFPGVFSEMSAKVRGTIVSTQAANDRAVGWAYPLAARMWELGEDREDRMPPAFGSVGTYGLQGKGVDFKAIDMNQPGTPYEFGKHKHLNVDATPYMKDIDPFSGSHCSIDNPGVANLFWQLAKSV